MKPGPPVCLLAASAAGVLLTVPVPSARREVQAALDLAHAPAFGVLALVALHAGRSWLPGPARRAAAWAVVAVFGAVMEYAQSFSGRHPSWEDALANALGAAAFLSWDAARGAATRGGRLALAAAGAALVAAPSVPPLLTLADGAWQARDFPRLASFERPTELSRWDFRGCRAGRSHAHATDGVWSLRLDLAPGPYPAATLSSPPRDWSGRGELTFDAHLGPGPPLDLVVKVEDRRGGLRYGDRSERVVRLLPGPQRVRLDLAGVRRTASGGLLDLREVALLQLFAVDLASPRTLHLDDVRLR